MVRVTKYATVINNQIPLNKPNTKFDWQYTNRAVSEAGRNKDGADWAYAKYKKNVKKNGKKTTTSYQIPEALTAHKFNLNIPVEAYIDNVTIIADYKVSKGITVKAPYGKFMIYGGNGKVNQVAKGKTGWYDKTYCVYPSNNISTKDTQVKYTISGKEWNKIKYPTKQLNQHIMGIDLYPQIPSNMTSTTAYIYLNWVKIVVDYTLPKTTVSYSISNTSESNPYECLVGDEFDLNVIINQNKVDGGTKKILFDVPWGTDVTGLTNPYSFRASPNRKVVIPLKFNPNGIGIKEFNTIVDNVGVPFYYYPLLYNDSDYFKTNITSTEMRKGVLGCFTFNIQSESTNSSETFKIIFDKPNLYANILLDKEVSSEGVEIISCTPVTDGYEVVCNVPTHTLNTIKFDLCVYPRESGEQSVSIKDLANNESYTYKFNCLEAYDYHLGNTSDITDTQFNILALSELRLSKSHHVPSEVESKGLFFNCSFQDGDSVMTMKDNNLTAYYYEPIDYIGCVPLEHLHFDPKSTYKDTLLNNKYKNNTFMGKKLASDEDITLNVRLHPQQVTTIQGLIDIDKPIPINANHRCFEGDALNHRGWCEIYGIKAEETNPHWYKCDIDVKYITHNLNTRFTINRGVKSYPTSIPDLVAPVLNYHDNILDYFNVTTNGTYTYNEDYISYDENIEILFEDNQRHQFELESGQSVQITSKDKLSNRTNIVVDWSTAKMAEDKENLVSRVFRIKNQSNTVFEYEYSDFDFNDANYISCNVIGRQLRNGSYDPLVIDKIIDLRVDDDSDVDEETGEVINDTNDVYFGSVLHFELTGKKLKIIDEGFNGKEVSVTLEDELEGDSFYFEAEVINHNQDMETEEVISYLNFYVEDTLLSTSRFYDRYDRMIVSPFPVSDNKRLLFVREAKEGVIYYYEEDELEKFSYIIDPYYQYKNGADLTYLDNSILSLNYGYNPVYMENGLVKLGFNRLNGNLYLSKWDNKLEDYVPVSKFHLGNEKDVDLSYISDDKIVLSAGDSKFTIWRGHPYIMINHSAEDIYIDTVSSRVWAEDVGNDVSEYPVYYDLMNTKNLLPKEYGGNKIDTDGLVVSDDDVAHLDLELYGEPSIVSGVEATFGVRGTVGNVDVDLPVSEDYSSYKDNVFGETEWEIIADNNMVYPPLFMITNNGLSVTAHVCDVDGKGIKDKAVKFYQGTVLKGTVVTDNNGDAKFDFTTGGTVKAVVGTIESNELEITV